jgi:hypothetical protein
MQDSPPDAALAHELYHAYRFAIGKFLDGGNSAEEAAATNFENNYRWYAGHGVRTEYEVVKAWGVH